MALIELQPTSLPRLVLASSSRYRIALLSRLGLPFTSQAPEIDETPQPSESADNTALRLACQKAEAIASCVRDCLIIGSDQVAVLDGEQIGKPGNHANALAQLKKMQGRTVVFHTALCLLDNRDSCRSERMQKDNVQTAVTFRSLSEKQLDHYLRIEQPYDCAGSAKNEALGIALIASMTSSDPTALTGLPLIALTSMLMNAGIIFFGGFPESNS